MRGIILKREKEDEIFKMDWEHSNYLYFRPTEYFIDVVTKDIKNCYNIREIVNNHDKEFKRFEIDNLFLNFIQDIKNGWWYDNVMFLINEDYKIIGEALIIPAFKFKLQTVDDWSCNFCRKGDHTEIKDVVCKELSNSFYWDIWFKKLGKFELQNSFIKKKHQCSNCQQWLSEYKVANKKLKEFMNSLKDKNYWVFSMSDVKKYENWKDFNFKKVNVLTYEKNK